MKIVKCDICGKTVDTVSDSVPVRDYWVKLVSRFVRNNYDHKNEDLCNGCYQVVRAFIKLLAENNGKLEALLYSCKTANVPLMHRIHDLVMEQLSRPQ